MEMVENFYFETLESVLRSSILHYCKKQQAKSNEQNITSNKQKVTSNEKKVTSKK